MNNISSLMRELNALVESRTLFRNVASCIAKLRDQAIAAEKKIADLEDQLKNARTSNSALDSNNAKLNARLNEWKAREESLAAREKKMTELERDLAVANAKGAAFDEINKRMLANRILREDIYHSNQVPIPTQHGGYMHASQTETKQRTVKDEA